MAETAIRCCVHEQGGLGGFIKYKLADVIAGLERHAYWEVRGVPSIFDFLVQLGQNCLTSPIKIFTDMELTLIIQDSLHSSPSPYPT